MRRRIRRFDKESARTIRVGRLVEHHRFEASGNDLRHPWWQQHDIEYRRRGGGKDGGPALLGSSEGLFVRLRQGRRTSFAQHGGDSVSRCFSGVGWSRHSIGRQANLDGVLVVGKMVVKSSRAVWPSSAVPGPGDAVTGAHSVRSRHSKWRDGAEDYEIRPHRRPTRCRDAPRASTPEGRAE